MQETGPTVYGPYPRRPERLTICRYNYKGSTFSSVINALGSFTMVLCSFGGVSDQCGATSWAAHETGMVLLLSSEIDMG